MAIRLHLYRRGAEKEGEPAEQTETDGEGGKSQTRCFQVRIVENRRAGEACKSEHFGDAAVWMRIQKATHRIAQRRTDLSSVERLNIVARDHSSSSVGTEF